MRDNESNISRKKGIRESYDRDVEEDLAYQYCPHGQSPFWTVKLQNLLIDADSKAYSFVSFRIAF